jgi:hypothetical protein
MGQQMEEAREAAARNKATRPSDVSFYISYRFMLAIIGFFGYMLQYMQKSDIGIAIVWYGLLSIHETSAVEIKKRQFIRYVCFSFFKYDK